MVKAVAQRMQQGLAHRQVAVARVAAFDHHPRCFRRAGFAQGVLGHLAELVVPLEALPILGRYPPARFGVFLQRLETLALRFLGQVEPELEYQRAFVGQHALEVLDLFDMLAQLGGAALLHHPAHDGRGVPGTEEHADLTFRRQGAPKTPHGRTLAFLLRHFGHRMGLDMARIHPFVEQVDRLPLACAIHPADQDNDLEFPLFRQVELRVEQVLAQLRNFLFIGFFVNSVSEFG